MVKNLVKKATYSWKFWILICGSCKNKKNLKDIIFWKKQLIFSSNTAYIFRFHTIFNAKCVIFCVLVSARATSNICFIFELRATSSTNQLTYSCLTIAGLAVAQIIKISISSKNVSCSAIFSKHRRQRVVRRLAAKNRQWIWKNICVAPRNTA